MKIAAKIIVWTQETKKGSNSFNVKIRFKSGDKYTYISLPFYLTGSEKKNFINRKGEIIPSYKDYNEIQQAFKLKLKELDVEDVNDIPINRAFKVYTFSSYLLKYIEDLKINSQYGLLQKTNTLKLNLEKYWAKLGKTGDILFSDITIDFLNDFKNFLTLNNVKPVSQKGYFEKMRVILNKAIKEDKYNPKKHPFLNFEFNKIIVAPKHLKPDEFRLVKAAALGITKLLNLKKETYINLNLTKESKKTALKWLFQYYCYGMRVSDLLLIRYSNIYEGGKRLKFRMYKTKSDMDIVLNTELLDIFYEFLPLEIKREIVKKSASPAGTVKRTIDGVLFKFNKKTEYYDLIRYYLYTLSTNQETKNKRFFSKISPDLDEVKNIKEIYSQVATYTAVYNKQLKKLSKELEECSNIPFSISSHMARHTFAYLSLLEGKNVYYISQALNHKSVKTTENYLKGFPQRHLDNKFYNEEIKIEEKKEIDDKLKVLIANASYEKKKKILELFIEENTQVISVLSDNLKI